MSVECECGDKQFIDLAHSHKSLNFETCITLFFSLSKIKLPTHMYTHSHNFHFKVFSDRRSTSKNRKKYQMKIPCIYRFQNFICLLIVSVCACVCVCVWLLLFSLVFTHEYIYIFPSSVDFRSAVLFKDEYTYEKTIIPKKYWTDCRYAVVAWKSIVLYTMWDGGTPTF